MADPPVADIMRDTGYVYWNPVSTVNLGTQLGYIKSGISVYPNYQITPVTSELTGLIPQMFIYSGLNVILQFELISISQTSLQRAFLQTVVGLAATIPGTPLTGKDLVGSTTSGSILFVPENTTSHPCIYSSSCFAVLDGGFGYNRQKPMSLPLLVYCTSVKTGLLSSILA
jgi:hypothetical protein